MGKGVGIIYQLRSKCFALQYHMIALFQQEFLLPPRSLPPLLSFPFSPTLIYPFATPLLPPIPRLSHTPLPISLPPNPQSPSSHPPSLPSIPHNLSSSLPFPTPLPPSHYTQHTQSISVTSNTVFLFSTASPSTLFHKVVRFLLPHR